MSEKKEKWTNFIFSDLLIHSFNYRGAYYKSEGTDYLKQEHQLSLKRLQHNPM